MYCFVKKIEKMILGSMIYKFFLAGGGSSEGALLGSGQPSFL